MLKKSSKPKATRPSKNNPSQLPFSVDLLGHHLPLPETERGNWYILVVVVVTDLFSKCVEVFPLTKTDSKTLATIQADEIICRYGAPS